ncbi:MAG: sulfurtransferase TusA family protein [Candidatus Kariarchaeaceae archaeon]
MTDFDQELDCRGLSCPMPILKLTKAMKKLDSGKVLKMIGSDPGSKQDVPDWCTRKGHELLDQQEDGGETSFFIQKK